MKGGGAELFSQRDGWGGDIVSSMVISECNGQSQAKSDEDVCFDTYSASEPRGPVAEILADANRCFKRRPRGIPRPTVGGVEADTQ